MWMIRDARGLDASAKAILWAVESRGVTFSSAETLARDCGMTVKRFYRWRRSLADQGLLQVTERAGTTTEYRVDAAALGHWGSSRIDQGGLPKTTRGDSPDRLIEEEPQDDPQEHQRRGTAIHPDAEKAPVHLFDEPASAEVEMCDKHPQFAMPCGYCAQRAHLDALAAKHPEFKQQGWYEDENESESLARGGGGPLLKTRTPRYQGRRSSA